ncbi:MAG: MlaD family protein [Rhizonema sp. NSF051]|nr:MlaD family protein [Rhizonema sp. NSF051]
MRSRSIREGSVGLLFLVGLGVLGLILLWLNRLTFSKNSYKAIVEFTDAGGMQKGAVVRYRGVKVGNISAIRPGANKVEVEIEIAQRNLVIPRHNLLVEANQSGLISEGIIDITPRASIPAGTVVTKPMDKNCDPQIIVCNGTHLMGQIGVSIDELIRSSTQLTSTYSSDQFYRNLNKTVENAGLAASNVAELSRSFNVVSKSLQKQINSISTTSATVQRATNQLTTSSTQTLNEVRVTARQFGTTATQANRLVNKLDTLVTTNRSSLVSTLNNISQTSEQLRSTVSSLSPALNRITQGQLLKNLETLSANATQASANLRDITKGLNNPNNVTVLQQTLDSARVTFENTQKITSDLDELTGDPKFRRNLRQLVNGLSTLVSSTQQMQQQVQIATTLDSAKAAVINNQSPVIPATLDSAKVRVINNQTSAIPTLNIEQNQKQMVFDLSPTALKSDTKQSQPTTAIFPSPSSQEKLLKQLREYGRKGSK